MSRWAVLALLVPVAYSMAMYDYQFKSLPSIHTPDTRIPFLSSVAYDSDNDQIFVTTNNAQGIEETQLTIAQYSLASRSFLQWVQLNNVNDTKRSRCFVAARNQNVACIYR